jgi:hypothetical protein
MVLCFSLLPLPKQDRAWDCYCHDDFEPQQLLFFQAFDYDDDLV